MAVEQYYRALGYTLLAYMISIIALITLIPFSFAIPKTLHFTLRGNIEDVFNNIVLFVPLGYFFQATHGRAGWRSLLGGLCFGLAVSGAVEAGQLFIPSRHASIIDILTNTMGALLGAALAGCHQRMVRKGQMQELFGFGLPLVSLVYLLIPLLWLEGFSMGNESPRLLLIGLVGLFGGGVISSAVANRSGRPMRRIRSAVFAYTWVWFVIGTAFSLTHFPRAILVMALCVSGMASGMSAVWKRPGAADRRFELPTLKRLIPLYLVYLLLLSVWPTTVPLGQWSLQANFQVLNQSQRILFVSRFVEVIAAFTLLGYLTAEVLGRRQEPSGQALKRVLLWVLGVAVCTGVLRNRLAAPGPLVVETLIFTVAAMYGAIIYRLQLIGIRKRILHAMQR